LSTATGVDYRLLQPDEEEAVLDLWCEVFPDTKRESWREQFVWDSDRFRRTYVAVDAGGTPLSTVRYCVLSVRDAASDEVLMGWLTNVATRPSAQRRGHAGRLIRAVIEAMQREGCRWSFLSAREDAAGLYERYGWRRLPFGYRQGLLAKRHLPTAKAYAISTHDPIAEGWQPIAAVYEKYNALRPMSVVRDQAYWQEFIAMRFAGWKAGAGAQMLVAKTIADAATLSGYAVALFSQMGVLIAELCVLPGEEEVIPALFNAMYDELHRNDFPQQGRVYLPDDVHINAALVQFFDATLHAGHDYFLLVRTLDNGDAARLDATLAAPNAHYWLLDEF
jgi:ribosomal protein S18 acetylase RimI-like enzyme